mmetsp:Transcript_23482/g.73514  ORF Transcript_23482/g.73514 Transcript_23482/m.73514 type:complete len:201 (+) Transcript_23482:986-1588(+)
MVLVIPGTSISSISTPRMTLWDSYGAWRRRIPEASKVSWQDGNGSTFPLFPRATRAVRESMNDTLLLSHINPGAAKRLQLARRVAAMCRLCDMSFMHTIAPIVPLASPLSLNQLGCLFTSNCSCRDQSCVPDFPLLVKQGGRAPAKRRGHPGPRGGNASTTKKVRQRKPAVRRTPQTPRNQHKPRRKSVPRVVAHRRARS